MHEHLGSGVLVITGRQREGGPLRTQSTGFTLIELTIAVAILGLVMSGITSAILVAMRATQESQARLDESGALRLASVYLTADAHGANTFTANRQSGFPAAAQAPSCGAGASPLVLELAGADYVGPGSPAGTTTISYVLTEGGTALERRACATPSRTARDALVVASGLSAGTTPTVSCRTASGTAVACSTQQAVLVTLTTTGADGATHSATAGRRTS